MRMLAELRQRETELERAIAAIKRMSALLLR